MKEHNLVLSISTAIGVAMLIGTFFIYKGTVNFLETATVAQGTVIDLLQRRHQSGSSSSSSITYTSVVRFTDVQGRLIEFNSSISSNPPDYDVGEAVEVLYEPLTPQTAKIKGFFSLWGGVISLGTLGSFFLITGLGFFVYEIINNSNIKKKKF